MEVTIDPNSDTAIAKMTFQRSVNIDYSDGGNLAETMYGVIIKLNILLMHQTLACNH